MQSIGPTCPRQYFEQRASDPRRFDSRRYTYLPTLEVLYIKSYLGQYLTLSTRNNTNNPRGGVRSIKYLPYRNLSLEVNLRSLDVR